MEDLTVSANARFLTALSPYSPDQVASSLEQLSRLHAYSWRAKHPKELPWVGSRVQYFVENPPYSVLELQKMMDGERGNPLPAKYKNAARIQNSIAPLVEWAPPDGQCLTHGDSHAGNVYETAAGSAIIDWAMMGRASYSLDLAYHIGAVLSIESREASERHLIRHYLDCLRGLGVDAPSEDATWHGYRAHMAYAYYMWAITRKVPEPLTIEFVKRLGTAVISLGTFELLGV